MVSPLRRLFPYILRYRRAFALGLACVLGTTTLALVGPWLLKYAVDDLTTGVTRGKLAAYAGLLLAFAVGAAVFRFLMRRILIGASREIEYDLRNDVFAHLQRQPLSYFQANRTGDLMSRATNDLSAVRMMMGPAIMYATNTLVIFVVALVMMVSIDPGLTFIAMLPLPIVSIAVKFFGAAIHRRFQRIQEQLSELSAVVQEALAGVRVVRAYRQEQAELARFEAVNEEYVRRSLRLIRLQGLFYPSLSFFLGLGALLVLWLGSAEVIPGRISLGEFVAFNAYLAMLSWPVIAFGFVTNMIQRGMASWKRLLEVLDAEPAIVDPAEPVRVSSVEGRITFRHLSFAYGDRVVLRDIDLDVAAGETVAFLGRTGSGKSTLISLVPRLQDPPPGTVFVDGHDVRDLPLATLRGAIGFVAQEPFLFSDTLADNVAFGVPAGTLDAAARREAVVRAAAVARLDKDVEAFPDGYDTRVGERGITLSGGQKQRAALARAVMLDSPVLILDDALSAVDTYTEEEILARLAGVMRQRTTLIVSHRVSTVRHADRIVVLDRGSIAEHGTHDELIRRGGLYAELYRKQQLEEELAAS